MYSLLAAGKISANTWAMAFCGTTSRISIGGVRSSLYSGAIDYAAALPLFGSSIYGYGYYMVQFAGLKVGTSTVSTAATVASLNDAIGGLMLDSGTTRNYLPAALHNALKSQVQSSASKAKVTNWKSFFNVGSSVTDAQLAKFPTVTFTIAKTSAEGSATFDVVLTPDQYTFSYMGYNYWMFASSTVPILGYTAMQGRTMVFDITNNRVGFGTAACAATSSNAARPPMPMPEMALGSKTTRRTELGSFLAEEEALLETKSREIKGKFEAKIRNMLRTNGNK
jgi:hypothetical protein